MFLSSLAPQISMAKLRFDRVVSVHLGHPLSRVMRKPCETRVPILMYHSIRDGAEGRHPYFGINTSPGLFARQMKFLREEGYVAVTLDVAVNFLSGNGNHGRFVAITFDDGYRDFYTDAYPTLAENGHTGTVFLATGLVKDQRFECNGRGYMTWNEVRELSSKAIRFGSHTVTHPQLRDLSQRKIEYEAAFSKKTIEDKIGDVVTSFSYPFAFPEHDKQFVQHLTDTLEKHGYKNGVSTVIGTARCRDDHLFLPRLPVNSGDDLRFFRAKLEGGYDWLHPIQYCSKLVRAKLV